MSVGIFVALAQTLIFVLALNCIIEALRSPKYDMHAIWWHRGLQRYNAIILKKQMSKLRVLKPSLDSQIENDSTYLAISRIAKGEHHEDDLAIALPLFIVDIPLTKWAVDKCMAGDLSITAIFDDELDALNNNFKQLSVKDL